LKKLKLVLWVAILTTTNVDTSTQNCLHFKCQKQHATVQLYQNTDQGNWNLMYKGGHEHK
jgi:hypothetical protein